MKPRSRADVGVVIAGGGKGARMGGSVPKQFRRLAGVPILLRTLALFSRDVSVQEIVVVVPEEYVKRAERLIRGAGVDKVSGVVPGGADRQESVWNGLHAFVQVPTVAVVHDAVRPLIRRATLAAVVAAARVDGAAVPGVRVHDTIKEEDAGFVVRTIPRERLYAIQTPQAFRFELLMRAHAAARVEGYTGTDDAGLVERLGLPVRIVPGQDDNMKVTTPADMALAAALLRR